MPNQQDKDTAAQMGLHDGQMRVPAKHQNLWWSITGDPTLQDGRTFGFGDLDESDILKIHRWTRHPCNYDVVFTGWNQHHGEKTQQFPEAVIEISFLGGVRYPHLEAVKARREQDKQNLKVVK